MTEFSKDELVAPTWLDKGFFERALRSYEHDPTIEVQKFIITPGTKPGEHFASVMYKIDVTYSSKKYRFDNKTIKLIMKTYPVEEGFKKEILMQSPAFKNEIRMYTRVLPEMERVLANAGDHTIFAPPLVYESLDKEPLPVIVFVDVSDQEFKIFDDLGINSMKVMEVIVEKLAKFHATSLYLEENGEHLTEFHPHFFQEEIEKGDKGMMTPMLNKSIGFLTSQIKDWGPEWSIFYEKLNGKVNVLMEKVLEVYYRKENFKVLCHGDFHNKNMLQRNGCVKDEDLLFIDYQFPHWSSPAMDLYYVFNILAHSDIAEPRRNEFVKAYYQEFVSTLKKVGYRGAVPSLVDLQIELIECAHVELLQNLMFVSPRFVDWTKLDMEKFFTEPEAMLKAAIQNPAYRKFLKDMFVRHLNMGTMNLI